MTELAQPEGMTARATDVWARLLPACDHLKPEDATMLAQLCEAIAVTERLATALEKPIMVDRGTITVSPAYNAWRSASTDVRSLSAALALTPATRGGGGTPDDAETTRRRLYRVRPRT